MIRHIVTSLVAVLLVVSSGSRVPTGAQQSRPSSQAPIDTPVVARVTVRNEAELRRLVRRGLDLLETREGDDLFIMTTDAQVEELRREGWRVRVDSAHTATARAQVASGAATLSVSALTFRGGYQTVPSMRAALEQAALTHPQLAEFFVYGNSWERLAPGGSDGFELFGIKLTNKSTAQPKPTLFLMAAIHARELSTSELALRFIDYLLANYGVDADATWLLDSHQIVVVPVVNPDGRVIAEQGYYQRKNTNTIYGGGCANPPTSTNQYGVDLNRNASFRWGTVNTPTEPPCGQTFPGGSPASEPEILALENLIRTLFPDQRGPGDTDAAPESTTGIMITLHSYSNLVLWPWGTTSTPAPNAAGLSMIGGKFAAYNGYLPEQSIQLYPTSGTTDEWAYGELGIPAFTFEVGGSSGTCGGFFPAYSCLDGGTDGSFWPRNLPAFIYAARIAEAPYRLVKGPTPDALSAVTTSTLEIRALFDERYNGGQTVVAAEYFLDEAPLPGAAGLPMLPVDGAFNSSVEEAIVQIAPLTAGRKIFVRAQDSAGNWGPVRAVFAPARTCGFTVSPASAAFPVAGGTGSLNVGASTPDCTWTATSSASWIAVTSGASGTGDGVVTYAVAANTTTSARTATLLVGGKTVTVSQAAPCSYAISPANRSIGSGGGSGTVAVTSPTGCGWTAVSSVNWVTISSGATGTGNGSVVYNVARNTATTSRTGTIAIADKTFTVTQSRR